MIEERVSAVVGRPLRALRPVETRGYATAFHAIAEFEDGTTAFVKGGAEEVTSEFLRDELRFYESVQAPFVPELLGYDYGDPPLLVIEDLSGARWPPPWDDAMIEAVRATLAAVAATPPPDWVVPIANEAEWLLGGWADVESDPEPFLGLGLRSAAWLDRALPTLRAAAEAAVSHRPTGHDTRQGPQSHACPATPGGSVDKTCP